MTTNERLKLIAKELLEKSEIALMSEKIDMQNRQIARYEERITNLEKRMGTYIEATMALAKETKTQLVIRSLKIDGRRHGRSDGEVEIRWKQWKAEFEAGVPFRQIAARWGMDPSTVKYAWKHNWIQPKNKIFNRQSTMRVGK